MAVQSQFTITLRLEDSKSGDLVHFKMDGGRFSKDPESSRTLKLNNTIKYQVSVIVNPNVEHIRSIVLGTDELTADREKLKDNGEMAYEFSWITTGYAITPKGKRNMLKVGFYFDNNTEVSTQMQCKFYNLDSSSHLKWGTPINKLEFVCNFDIIRGQTHTPTEIRFK